MIAFRKYSWLGLIAARSNLAYLGEVATRTLFLAVILYILQGDRSLFIDIVPL